MSFSGPYFLICTGFPDLETLYIVSNAYKNQCKFVGSYTCESILNC